MEDGNTEDSTMDLRNLETKVGMKIPESLLRWMQDDVQDYNSPVSEYLPSELLTKIQTLKLEMRKLRSADVKILQQLKALNEEMECMRWLWEEHISPTSLSTSQSSQNSTFTPINQAVSDMDEDHHQLTSAEHAKQHGHEAVVDQCVVQRSSNQSVVNPEIHEEPVLDEVTVNESQRLLLGHGESLSEDPRLLALQDKQNDQDPCLLGGEQLLGYDIRWNWVECEDDVMFL